MAKLDHPCPIPVNEQVGGAASALGLPVWLEPGPFQVLDVARKSARRVGCLFLERRSAEAQRASQGFGCI